MKLGYARVSRDDQNIRMQMDALKAAKCDKIYTDKLSGTKESRKGLDQLLSFVREGDTIVVWKLDRLGRTVKQLVFLMEKWKNMGIQFECIVDKIDTSTAWGNFYFVIMAAMAQLERDLISERTKAGLTAARARGRIGGRPKGLNEEAQKRAKLVAVLYEERKMSVAEVAKFVGVSRGTVYKYLVHEKFEKCPESGTYLREKPKTFYLNEGEK